MLLVYIIRIQLPVNSTIENEVNYVDNRQLDVYSSLVYLFSFFFLKVAATANQFDFQTASDSALSANGFDALRYSGRLS